MSNQNRQPAGVPTGGQFATGPRDESTVNLSGGQAESRGVDVAQLIEEYEAFDGDVDDFVAEWEERIARHARHTGAQAWGEAVQAVAWATDNGPDPLSHVTQNNPYLAGPREAATPAGHAALPIDRLEVEWQEAFSELKAAGVEHDADHPAAARYRDASNALNHANRKREQVAPQVLDDVARLFVGATNPPGSDSEIRSTLDRIRAHLVTTGHLPAE